jgi:hypothetical protein
MALRAAHKSVRERHHVVPDARAVVPAAGVSMADENPAYGEMIHVSIASTPEGVVPLPFEALQADLMPGDPLELQKLVHELLLPQPGGYMTDALSSGPSFPAAYLLSENDQSLARPGDEFAGRLGLEPAVVPGSHMALLTHPEEIAAAISAAARL